MSEIRVTKERVDHLMGTAEKQVIVFHAKHMTLVAKLENGFVIETSSGCIDPKSFDEELGEEVCTKKLKDKIWELESYAMQKQEYENKMNMIQIDHYDAEIAFCTNMQKRLQDAFGDALCVKIAEFEQSPWRNF